MRRMSYCNKVLIKTWLLLRSLAKQAKDASIWSPSHNLVRFYIPWETQPFGRKGLNILNGLLLSSQLDAFETSIVLKSPSLHPTRVDFGFNSLVSASIAKAPSISAQQSIG